MYELLRFLHALTMIAAVCAAVLPTLVLHAIARASSPAGIETLAPVALRARAAASPLIVVAAGLGAAAAVIAGLNPMQPWLIGAYVTFTVALLTGAVAADPWARRVNEAARASAGREPSLELRAAINDPRGALAGLVLVAAVVIIVFLGVHRPGA